MMPYVSNDDLNAWLLSEYNDAVQGVTYLRKLIFVRNQQIGVIINLMLEMELPNRRRIFTADELNNIAAKYILNEEVSLDGQQLILSLTDIPTPDPTIGNITK